MKVQGRVRSGENVLLFIVALSGWALFFPRPAHAIEVGCFCTFVFVSSMFTLGVGVTLVVKNLIAKKFWNLSWGRISLITFLEVVLLIAVLVVLQTKFYLRILAYLPFAFLLNYALTTIQNPALRAGMTPKKRLTLAALSSLALPVAVQVMGWLATVLSNMITFKEIRV